MPSVRPTHVVSGAPHASHVQLWQPAWALHAASHAAADETVLRANHGAAIGAQLWK
jgi:hypothetical protein